MASCLLAFGSVVRSGGGSQGERVGEACARACGMAHGRPRHCDPDRPRHQRQRPNASADRPHRGPRGRGRGLRGHLRGTARHAGARVPRSRHDPGDGPAGHRLAPARAACRRRPGSDRQPVRIGRFPDESGQRARSVQQSRRAAAPPATRPARIRSGSPTPRVRASRSPGRWARAGLQRDVRLLQSGGPRLVTIWPWPRSRRHRTCRSGGILQFCRGTRAPR
jgi:hypothetical protein